MNTSAAISTLVALLCVATIGAGLWTGSRNSSGTPGRGADGAEAVEYPRAVFIRLESLADEQEEDVWLAGMTRLGGYVARGGEDELASVLAPNVENPLVRLARAAPDQLVLLRFNQDALDPRWPRTQTFAADAWLYYPGCRLAAPVRPSDDAVCLPAECRPRLADQSRAEASSQRADDIVVIGHTEDGGDDWSRAEHMTIRYGGITTGPCPSEPTLASVTVVPVERGRFGSATRAFERGSYLAPHAAVLGSGLWQINYTRSAGQREVAALLERVLEPGGTLEHIDGLAFDVGLWSKDAAGKPHGRLVDVDLDGRADGGRDADGHNIYARGVEAFYTELRDRLPGRLLIAAGGLEHSQRAIRALDGAELDGLSGPDDGDFTRWSVGTNRLDFWRRHNPSGRQRAVTVVHKDAKEPTANEARMVFAIATILEAIVAPALSPDAVRPVGCPAWDRSQAAPVWDELLGGVGGVHGWLGAPLSEPVYLAASAEDRLAGRGSRPDAQFVARHVRVQDPGVEVVADEGDLVVRRSAGAGGDLEFRVVGLEAAAGADFLLTLEAQGEPLPGFDPSTPRLLTVEVAGASLPVVEGRPRQRAKLSGYVGTDASASARFYWRNDAPAELSFNVTVEGAGEVRIRGLRFLHATDAVARLYERGAVLVNPSVHRAVTFDLAALDPSRRFRRLLATPCQDAAHNDGSQAASLVVVPPSDGAFLADRPSF